MPDLQWQYSSVDKSVDKNVDKHVDKNVNKINSGYENSRYKEHTWRLQVQFQWNFYYPPIHLLSWNNKKLYPYKQATAHVYRIGNAKKMDKPIQNSYLSNELIKK